MNFYRLCVQYVDYALLSSLLEKCVKELNEVIISSTRSVLAVHSLLAFPSLFLFLILNLSPSLSLHLCEQRYLLLLNHFTFVLFLPLFLNYN